MPVELKVPEVGESITEVQIGAWKRREGETVSLDDADRAADLLAAFVRGLEGPIDWAP